VQLRTVRWVCGSCRFPTTRRWSKSFVDYFKISLASSFCSCSMISSIITDHCLYQPLPINLLNGCLPIKSHSLSLNFIHQLFQIFFLWTLFFFGIAPRIPFCHSPMFQCFIMLYIINCVLNALLLLYLCLAVYCGFCMLIIFCSVVQ